MLHHRVCNNLYRVVHLTTCSSSPEAVFKLACFITECVIINDERTCCMPVVCGEKQILDDERTCCTPVMYGEKQILDDERTCCTPVMYGEKQILDDERTCCTPVMCGEKQILDDEFFLFSSPQLLSYQYTTLTKYSKHACSLVEARSLYKASVMAAKKLLIYFSAMISYLGGGGGVFHQPF